MRMALFSYDILYDIGQERGVLHAKVDRLHPPAGVMRHRQATLHFTLRPSLPASMLTLIVLSMMLLAEPRVVRGESDCDQDQSSDSMETTDPPGW